MKDIQEVQKVGKLMRPTWSVYASLSSVEDGRSRRKRRTRVWCLPAQHPWLQEWVCSQYRVIHASSALNASLTHLTPLPLPNNFSWKRAFLCLISMCISYEWGVLYIGPVGGRGSLEAACRASVTQASLSASVILTHRPPWKDATKSETAITRHSTAVKHEPARKA